MATIATAAEGFQEAGRLVIQSRAITLSVGHQPYLLFWENEPGMRPPPNRVGPCPLSRPQLSVLVVVNGEDSSQVHLSSLSSPVSISSPRWPTGPTALRHPRTVVRRSTRALHRTHSDLGYSLSASFPAATLRYLPASRCPTSSSAPLPTTISSNNNAQNSHRASATLFPESASGGYLMSSLNSTRMRFSWMRSQARSIPLIGCTRPICMHH